MEYRYLRAFLLTARHASFSKAASELKIAQSAVSRQIKVLEERMGAQLFVRSSTQVVLTELGTEIFRAASDFDEKIEGILHRERKPVVKIGVLHGVLETWLVSLVASIPSSSRSGLVIEMDHPDALIARLSRREIDLAITGEALDSETLTSIKLFAEKIVVISKRDLELEEIPKLPWITYADDDWLYQAFRRKPPKTGIRVNSMTAIVSLVKSGAGIAAVPSHVLGTGDESLRRLPLPLRRQPAIHLSMLNYDVLPPHLRAWVDLLRKHSSKKS